MEAQRVKEAEAQRTKEAEVLRKFNHIKAASGVLARPDALLQSSNIKLPALLNKADAELVALLTGTVPLTCRSWDEEGPNLCFATCLSQAKINEVFLLVCLLAVLVLQQTDMT